MLKLVRVERELYMPQAPRIVEKVQSRQECGGLAHAPERFKSHFLPMWARAADGRIDDFGLFRRSGGGWGIFSSRSTRPSLKIPSGASPVSSRDHGGDLEILGIYRPLYDLLWSRELTGLTIHGG